MIGVGRRVRVFVSTKPTDMRKSFHTLAQIVTSELGQDPLSGDIYLFVNARLSRAKALLWDGTGLCIYFKRLERGRFAAPWERSVNGAVSMTMSELALFLEGSKLVFIGGLSPEQVEPRPITTRALVVPDLAA